ncbi:MAG: aspartate carbamoyltransferase catalytic subunit, partial [candidate division WOR-3 bacterium]
GETLLDTARNIEAMKVDGVVIRHSASGAALFLGQRLDAFVVNAGDGTHEHPTQGLLDMMTMRQHFRDLKKLKVLIIGDVTHSRVARSNIFGLKTVGARVAICAPPTLIPLEIENLGVEVYHNLDEIIGDFDVVMALRIQLERQGTGLFPSVREYRACYGLTKERVMRMKAKSIIMHPGPTNRGVEIDPDVADSKKSVILEQVKNGVALRMAVLFIHAGGKIE